VESKGKITAKGLVILLLPLYLLFAFPVLYNTVDKKIVYQGQQVILTTWVACSQRPERVDWERLPSFNGFWMEEVTPLRRVAFLNTVRKGCWAYSVKAFALFPQHSGVLEIGDGVARIYIKGKKYVSTGNRLKIKILPIPEKVDWVGKLNLSLRITPEEGKLELVAEGYGNLDLLPPPEVLKLKGNLVFVGASVQKVFENKRLSGKKTFIYLTRGKTVSGEGFSYKIFDPETRKIKVVKTPSFKLVRQESQKSYDIFGFRNGFREFSPLFSSRFYWGVFFFLVLILVVSIIVILKPRLGSSPNPVKEINLLEEDMEYLNKEEFYSRLARLFSENEPFRSKLDHIRFSPFADSLQERKKLLEEAKKKFEVKR